MLERLLERISLSKYKNCFILKGGMLVSAILGVENRNTMDMDTTIKGIALTEKNICKIMNEICNINLSDNIKFKINKIEKIREEDDYNGFRLTLESTYNDEIPVILKVDITTGDKITYKEIDYEFNLLLENRKINIWTYNIETIIAEKFESIVKRGPLSTRIRDYYDVYMLFNLQRNNIDSKILKDAITETAKHRKSEIILKEWINIIDKLKYNDNMEKQWNRYKNNYLFANDIKYLDLIDTLEKIGKIYDMY